MGLNPPASSTIPIVFALDYFVFGENSIPEEFLDKFLRNKYYIDFCKNGTNK